MASPLPVSIEIDGDRAYLVHTDTGRRYWIVSFDQKERYESYPHPSYSYREYFAPAEFDVHMRLVEAQFTHRVPLWKPPKRRVSTHLGLRRPK